MKARGSQYSLYQRMTWLKDLVCCAGVEGSTDGSLCTHPCSKSASSIRRPLAVLERTRPGLAFAPMCGGMQGDEITEVSCSHHQRWNGWRAVVQTQGTSPTMEGCPELACIMNKKALLLLLVSTAVSVPSNAVAATTDSRCSLVKAPPDTWVRPSSGNVARLAAVPSPAGKLFLPLLHATGGSS